MAENGTRDWNTNGKGFKISLRDLITLGAIVASIVLAFGKKVDVNSLSKCEARIVTLERETARLDGSDRNNRENISEMRADVKTILQKVSALEARGKQ